MSAVSSLLIKEAYWIKTIGWLFLLYLGLCIFLTKNNNTMAKTQSKSPRSLNACFTPIFFAYKSLLGGFIICLLLALFVLLTIVEFYKVVPISAYLLIPYLLWGIFATFLSYKIFSLNR